MPSAVMENFMMALESGKGSRMMICSGRVSECGCFCLTERQAGEPSFDRNMASFYTHPGNEDPPRISQLRIADRRIRRPFRMQGRFRPWQLS